MDQFMDRMYDLLRVKNSANDEEEENPFSGKKTKRGTELNGKKPRQHRVVQ